MARSRKQEKRELKLVEMAAIAGAALGILQTGAPHAAAPCRGEVSRCLSHSIVGTLEPFVVHAMAGALAGTILVVSCLVLWHWHGRAGSAPIASRAIAERVRHEVWRRDQGRCVDCGSRARLEFDHIIPHSRGGSNTARNIELRCEPCNRGKGARI